MVSIQRLHEGLFFERSIRDGSTQESREPEIQRSRYLSQLEQTEEENDEKLYPPESKYTRFWSDFNHVYFSPDSIHSVFPFSQRLEDGQEGDETAWAVGLELFERYNKVSQFSYAHTLAS